MRRWTKRTGSVALGLGLSFAALARWATPPAAANRADPALPVQITIGPPPGPCPMGRVDAERSGHVRELPNVPKQQWHRRIRGGLTVPVAVDASGAIVVAASVAEIVQLNPDGSEQWHRSLRMSVASTQPVILSDGTRVVLTAIGQIWGHGPDGSLRFHVDLGSFGTDPRTSPLPREDGTVAVAIGSHLLILDRQGSIVGQADVGQHVVGALVRDGDGIIATTDQGTVLRWASPMPPHRIGSFHGVVREGAARMDSSTLLAVVDTRRLVSMNLQSGATTTLSSQNGMEGPPTIGAHSVAYITTTTGLLSSISPAGEEHRTKLTARSSSLVDGGAPAVVYAPASPPVLVDEAGRVAFARTDGRVGVASPEGQVHFAPKRACGTPVCVVPAGSGKFLVACRTGDLLLYGP